VAPKDPPPADIAKAKTLFAAGGKSYEKGDYAAAIQAFERSYTLSGRPSVLFSLGQAYKKRFAESQDQRHRAASIENLRAYLAAVPTGGRRADAIRALEDLGQRDPGPSGTGSTQAAVERKTILSIDSPTPGALISIDGGEGAPPQVDAEVAPGRHTIKVSAPGFIEQEFVMQALPGQTEAETYALEEAPVSLVLTIPSGATVHIDGRDQGESSKLSVSPGRHFLSISKSGYQSFGKLIEAQGGESREIAIDLTTTVQRDASLGLMIAGGATMIGGGSILALAFLAQTDAQAIEEERLSTGITSDQNEAYNEHVARRDLLRAAGVLVGGVGSVAFLAGGAMFFLDRQGPLPVPIDEGKRKAPVSTPSVELTFAPVVAPDEVGLFVGGRF
jgi:tetratricopeptide (TPR) repeat protein